MSYVVKSSASYLATSSRREVWTDEQRYALRFTRWEQAFDCAEAWRSGAGSRWDARVVKLVKKDK